MVIQKHVKTPPNGVIRLLSISDPEYPLAIKQLECPPEELYLWGQLLPKTMVAFVGTRGAHYRWTDFTYRMAGEIVQAGYGVLSGGAIGIDAAAHQGALDAGGFTMAILGSGLNQLYPPRNIELFFRIAEQGTVISSFPPDAPPRRSHFPQRNRLIAAWAAAVLVVEAPVRSGALNTASWARSLGVPVLSTGGGAGARRLLHQGAGLVEQTDQLLSVLRGEALRRVDTVERLEADQRTLFDLLSQDRKTVDHLASMAGWTVARTAATLIQLELQGLASFLPGGVWYKGKDASKKR